MDFIGIVGARKYRDKDSVEALVSTLRDDSVIVTSGCKGVCTWAKDAGQALDKEVLIYAPDLNNIRSRFEVPKRYYQRNRELVERCDFLHAFISSEGGYTGGTRFEIEYAIKLGKPVKIHWEQKKSETIYQCRFRFDGSKEAFSGEWQNFFNKTFAAG